MKYVVANWKMNPTTFKESSKLFDGIKKMAMKIKKTRIVVVPSFVHLYSLAHTYRGKRISLGAQDVYTVPGGAFTGEVSPTQLKDSGASWVIVGHSERRALGETSDIVAEKAESALKEGLKVIMCIGEKERDKEGNYLRVITEELEKGLARVYRKDIEHIVIAYEPLWAIGKTSKDAMGSHEMHQMSLFIRKVLIDLYGDKVAYDVPILYGGSVEPANAEELIKEGEIQGFLVGHASLNVETFGKIIEVVERYA